MNTVKKGNAFEEKSYELIKNAINEDKLGISPKYSRVFRKKGYFSQLRGTDIIFDLSIEVWPPDAERFSILYLIECKDYSTKKVPVDDIEEFLQKVQQIANHGYFIKAAFITNNSFQKGALNIANKCGLMLLEVNDDNKLSIKLHRAKRLSGDNELIYEKEFETFLLGVFGLNKVEGLARYSRIDIQNITIDLLNEIDESILKLALPTSLEKVMDYFKTNYQLEFEFEDIIVESNGKEILGYFDVVDNKIRIDKSVVNTERFAFLLAHEIGHFVLHRNLKIDQRVYDNFKDSEYDFMSNKYLLNNERTWIEWQANEFAANLILPNISFYARLIYIQAKLGISPSKQGHIYLDDQQVNQKDFRDIIKYLSEFFHTTPTTIISKLQTMELITFNRKIDSFESSLRNVLSDSKPF